MNSRLKKLVTCFPENMMMWKLKFYELFTKHPVLIFMIFVFALGIRLFIINNSLIWGYDPHAYLGLAKATLGGQSTPWMYPQITFIDRLPFAGIVFLSVIIDNAFGLSSLVTSRYFIAIIGAIGVIVLYLIASKLFNRETAIFSSFLLSVSPWYLAHSTTLYPDVLYFVLSAACLFFFVSKKRIASIDYYHLGLTFFFFAFITRPYAIILLPSILLSVWLGEQKRTRVLLITIYALSVAALCVMIIVYRTVSIVGDPLAVNLLYTRFSLYDQIVMFNDVFLYTTIFHQLANEITPVILWLSLFGIITVISKRKDCYESIPVILYIFLYIGYTVMFYSPYTIALPEDPSLQSLLTQLPPRALLPIHGFLVMFAGGFFVHIIHLLKKSDKLIVKVSKKHKTLICNSLVLLLIISSAFPLIYSGYQDAESYVYGSSEVEERYLQLATWINSNVKNDETILVSYSWKVSGLTQNDDLVGSLRDIAYTPNDVTEFLRYMIDNKEVRYVIYDPLWTASRIRFNSIPASIKEEYFVPVFTYLESRTPLIVYENLLRNHTPSLIFPVWDFEQENKWHVVSYPSDAGKISYKITESLGRNNTKGFLLNHTLGVPNVYFEEREYVQLVPKYDKGPYQLHPIYPSANYSINFWAKSLDFKGSISARPVFFDIQGNYLADFDWTKYAVEIDGDSDWNVFSFNLETPARAFFLLIRIQISSCSRGAIIFDDISLEYSDS